MAKIEKFEDLIAWQKARQLMGNVYSATRIGMFARDFKLCGQIQSAAVSIMSNVAEGFERNRPGEFHQFLSVAKGSCGEVRSLLYAALDVGYIDQEAFNRLKAETEEVGRIVNGLRDSIQRWRPKE
ncbi:MAG TPA: four helix bundle protein [Candidatus Kapabacteria bacterium]|jgi:four helix bundle protein|nr:four helix bundle protein [Candidatus Kapabacteria bacterium]